MARLTKIEKVVAAFRFEIEQKEREIAACQMAIHRLTSAPLDDLVKAGRTPRTVKPQDGPA